MARLQRDRYCVTFWCGHRAWRSVVAGPGARLVIERERREVSSVVCPGCAAADDTQARRLRSQEHWAEVY